MHGLQLRSLPLCQEAPCRIGDQFETRLERKIRINDSLLSSDVDIAGVKLAQPATRIIR